MWPNVEVLAVHDAVHDVFVKLLAHTRTREDNVQPVVEGAMRLLLDVLLSRNRLFNTGDPCGSQLSRLGHIEDTAYASNNPESARYEVIPVADRCRSNCRWDLGMVRLAGAP